ncbi:MAG: DUF3575 domain-containing protein [Flavobacteriales bacterium]|nr:DUF3575 domain-containing protein [Flavobacteriales bacterium]
MTKTISVLLWVIAFSCLGYSQNTVGNPSATITNTKDSVVVFHFEGKNNMFFKMGNQQSISLFGEMVNEHKKNLNENTSIIYVNGFCSAFDTAPENLNAIKNRSNQVKSYYITNYGLHPDNFATLNSTGTYKGTSNVVAITIASVAKSVPILTPEQIYQEQLHADWTQYPPKDTVKKAEEIEEDTVETEEIIIEQQLYERRSQFAVTTNALYWCALLPNGGLSFRFGQQWAINATGAYTWWSFSKGKKTYYIWEVAPSVSFFLSKEKKWRGHYFSAYWHSGRYDIKPKNDERGHQGDYWGAGLEYGYIFRIGKQFDLSLYIRGGYVFSNYKAYSSDFLPCYDYLYSNNKNLITLTGAGVSFIWRIGREIK